MASNLLQITSQFTNDSIATTPSPCQRCPTIIAPGEKRLYVAPVNQPDKPGRYVCQACMDHYLKKPSTTARVFSTAAVSASQVTGQGGGPNHAPQSATSSGTAVSTSTIRAMINESQRRGAHTPQGRVTAVPQQLTYMPALPAINNPAHFQQYFQPPTSIPQAGSSGYSSAHLQYEAEKTRWVTSAYKAPTPGQIPLRAQQQNKVNLLLQVSYELMSGKTEKTAIKEGMPIDYEIRPQDLVDWIKVTLTPFIHKLAVGFSWDFAKMTVCEALKPGTKKSDGSLVFAPPKNPIEFILIIDHEQWLQAENHNENPEPIYKPVKSMRSVTPDSSLKRKVPPSPEKFRALAVQPSLTKKLTLHVPLSDASILSYKSNPDSSSNKEKGNFKPLDHDEVRRGIAIGGHLAIMDQKNKCDLKITERVACFQINAVQFSHLCNSENLVHSKIIDGELEYLGYITYNKGNLLGKGTFKTAHLASLKWISNSSPLSGLGANTSEAVPVALKRPFDDSISGGKLKRFNYSDESQKVVTEGTMLGWADSLLRFAYEFIDHFIANQTPENPPFPIPQLRFVKALIAYSEKALNNVADPSSSTSHRAAYLLEELLPVNGSFVKYIHNADAVPLQDYDEPGYDTGIFLCFIQHLQFVLTHGQAYISDFQGIGNLLTDPQVMTHPSLIKQENLDDTLFGEGNVNSAFEAFTSQHWCNHYCKYFKLGKFATTTGTGQDTNLEEAN